MIRQISKVMLTKQVSRRQTKKRKNHAILHSLSNFFSHYLLLYSLSQEEVLLRGEYSKTQCDLMSQKYLMCNDDLSY